MNSYFTPYFYVQLLGSIINLNDLYLETAEEYTDTWLCVGGGNGQYIASGAVNDDKFPTLIDPSKTSTRKIDLTVGGQTGDYPENYILTLEQTLHGVKDFYETGEFSTNINWAYV